MERFDEYVSMKAGHLGHADRVGAVSRLLRGVDAAGDRKSIEPMAARVAPTQVRSAHQRLRWWIERDYQEFKQEFGLDHFEGRSWRGFHHHATLSIAAYGFLLVERLAQPKKLCNIRFWVRSLSYPPASGPAAPLRRQRNVPDSIATLRLELAAALIARLPHCPCCGKRTDYLSTR